MSRKKTTKTESKPTETKTDPKKVAETMLQKVFDQINGVKGNQKATGDVKIAFLGKAPVINVPAISTGALSLDMALGVGGYPHGRIIEIYGPAASGKTTMALHAIAEAQRAGYYAAFIDLEHSLDTEYAKKLGVDIDNLIFSQPNSGNEGMRIVDKLTRSGLCKLIVIDSVAALTTDPELEGEIDKSHMGQQARLMSQSLKILSTLCGKSGTTLLFTNQIRMKIGVMWGNPETTPGGLALGFYASQIIDLRRRELIKEGNDVIGAKTRAKVAKNKVAAPFKEAHFNIIYGKGIDKEADIINVAEEVGVITRSGAWYSYKGEMLGQGLTHTQMFLAEKPELMAQIRKETLNARFIKQTDSLSEEPE